MAKIEKIGSLYFDGQPKRVGVSYNGEQLSFGGAVPGREISWVRLQSGLLIADHCVCTNISWEDLDKKGFALGTPITIDGEAYWCRCLQVGSEEGEPNEWDSALDEAGEDNDLWHWDEAYFWGQETLKYGASSRAIRGYYSARHWFDDSATRRSASLGFRPALEYLGSAPCSPDTLVGKKTKTYCPDGVAIEGRLVDFSDYDIVLEASTPVPVGCSWATTEGRNIVIDQGNIIWLKEM